MRALRREPFRKTPARLRLGGGSRFAADAPLRGGLGMSGSTCREQPACARHHCGRRAGSADDCSVSLPRARRMRAEFWVVLYCRRCHGRGGCGTREHASVVLWLMPTGAGAAGARPIIPVARSTLAHRRWNAGSNARHSLHQPPSRPGGGVGFGARTQPRTHPSPLRAQGMRSTRLQVGAPLPLAHRG